MGSSPAKTTLTAAASVLLVAAVYVLRLDRAAGLALDDAYYVLLARSLVAGSGFALINSATAPILPTVPPGFPLVLAAIFRIAPGFPGNVLLLKAVSIAAMIGAGLAASRYAMHRRIPIGIAAAIGLAVALTPGFVFLATSTVMAECLFTLLQLAAIIAVDRAASGIDRHRLQPLILAALLVAVAWFIRSAGIALIAASTLFVLRRRGWRPAAAFAGVVAAATLPWLLYATLRAPSPDERDAYGGSIAVSYGDAVRLRVAGTAASGRASVSEYPTRAAQNLLNIFGRDTGALVAPTVFRGASESGEEVFALGRLGRLAGSMGNAPPTIALSLLLSAVLIVGCVDASRTAASAADLLVPFTIAMLLLYPYWTYRFVLPLAPYLFLYLAAGLRWFAAWFRAVDTWRPARIALAVVVVLQIVDHVQYIRLLRHPGTARIDWLTDAAATDRALVWVAANLPSESRVASTNPALVYLRTGLKGVTFDGSTVKEEEWRGLGIRYVVSLHSGEIPGALARGRVVYRDPERRWWIVEIGERKGGSAQRH